jgi:hypothetical protein
MKKLEPEMPNALLGLCQWQSRWHRLCRRSPLAQAVPTVTVSIGPGCANDRRPSAPCAFAVVIDSNNLKLYFSFKNACIVEHAWIRNVKDT